MPSQSASARAARTALGSGAVLSLGAALVGPVPAAGAATFSVTNSADAGPGSLRQAILDANALAGDDEITFAPGLGTITLTTGQIPITDALTLSGPGRAALAVSGNNRGGIFYVNTPDAVTISGLTLTNGGIPLSSVSDAVSSIGADLTIASATIQNSRGGGGVRVDQGSLTVTDSLITGNTSPNTSGGGIVVLDADLEVTESQITGNHAGRKTYNPGTEYEISIGSSYAYGGGLAVFGTGDVTLSGSTFGENQASRGGGGLFFQGSGVVAIDDVTVSGNSAVLGGGLRFKGGADVTISDTTVADNHGQLGGGARFEGVDTLGITGSTFSGNDSEGVVTDHLGDLTIEASTIADNDAGGVVIYAETASVRSSTISGNGSIGVSALNPTHAVGNRFAVAHSTIVDNGTGMFLDHLPTTLEHTIVGDSSGYSDIRGQGGALARITIAHSLVESAPIGLTVTDGGGNVNGVDPGLLPLADNGGPTLTRALAPGSPAADAGDGGFVAPPATDQRGLPRVSGDAIDIGAVEAQVTPVILGGGAAVTEGNAGSRVVNVKVRLSTKSGYPVTVDWSTGDSVDQPAEGIDYESASGSLTFAPGETLKTVPITILADTVDEPEEWVPVLLTNPTNATIGGFGLGFGVIRDDDPAPTILPGGGAVTEGNAGSQVVQVKVKLSGPSGFPVTVHWATGDSQSQPAVGVDYESASGSVTFAPGETLKTVAITVLGDTVDEPEEWVPVLFTNPTNATISGYGLGFGVIRDDD